MSLTKESAPLTPKPATWKTEIVDDIKRALSIADNLTVSEWADKYRVLSQAASAESGKWKTSRTPYLKEIMDCLSANSTPKKVVFMKGAQIGGTEAGLNWIGYIIHRAPGPTLIVNPSIDTSKRNSKMRIMPMIEATKILSKCIMPQKSRDSGNTILQKEFKGGVLIMTGANAPSGLRSVPIRYLFLDEIDEYPKEAGTEGDPVDLAIQRTATFSNKKIFMISTPTIKDASRIEQAFLEGDQRYYHVPCPYCNHYQVLRWRNVVFDSKNLTEACYKCEKCGVLWHNWEKETILARGHWIATKPLNTDVASFHLSSLYSPHGWISWTDIAKEFLAAKDEPSRLQVWTNTKLADPWEDMAGEQIDPTNLMIRREHFGEYLPAGVAVLTAGVDVQDNRLEVEVVGWGRGEESWSIEYLVLFGDPSTPELWGQLDEVLMRRYAHSKNIPDLGILACCVDSGGHYTDHVINYCYARSSSRVFAIKGDGGYGKPIWPATASKSWKTKKPVYVIGVNDAKDTLMRRLHIPDCTGCWHFPMERGHEWFEQLTNEIVKKRFSHGRLIREWRPRKDGVRTEALDCRVYAYAALRALVRNYRFNLDYSAEQMATAEPRKADKQQTEQPNTTTPKGRSVRSKGIDL
ncbi:MAG: phage terminase large subunit family protein [Alphaproteobacteria bacterium]|nr:phage terminase large subunit family protein [Alphaproteobacteria bacterium]